MILLEMLGHGKLHERQIERRIDSAWRDHPELSELLQDCMARRPEERLIFLLMHLGATLAASPVLAEAFRFAPVLIETLGKCEGDVCRQMWAGRIRDCCMQFSGTGSLSVEAEQDLTDFAMEQERTRRVCQRVYDALQTYAYHLDRFNEVSVKWKEIGRGAHTI